MGPAANKRCGGRRHLFPYIPKHTTTFATASNGSSHIASNHFMIWYVKKDVYHNYSNISSPVDCCHDVFLRRCSDGDSAAAVDIGNDPALVATADAFDMGAPSHRWGRSCAKLAAPARSSGILSSEADSPWLAMGGGGSCLKRSCTSGEVTRRVGPEENTSLGDRSLDSRCAAGGTMATVVCTSKNRATSSLSSRLAPVKLISTSEPSLIVTLMRSGRRFRLWLGCCNLPRSSRSRNVAIAAVACQQRTN